MQNQRLLVDKLREYVSLNKKIQQLSSELVNKENEIKKNYQESYEKVRRDLNGYIIKIKPTVETVCTIYRDRLVFKDNYIYFNNGQIFKTNYTPFDACELAFKLGNEGIRLLTMVIQRKNVDTNLGEFAMRYNTVIDIYNNVDKLKSQAIIQSLARYQVELNDLKAKRDKICKTEGEYKELVGQIKAYGQALVKRILINDSLVCAKDFKTDITLSLGYETIAGLDTLEPLALSSLAWDLHRNGVMVVRKNKHNLAIEQLATMAVNTALQFLFAYPATSKRVLLCDSYSTQEITTFAGSLKDANRNLFFDSMKGSFVKNADEEIRDSLAEINKTISNRIMLLGQSRYDNILEYNKQNQDNPQPIILIILNGYPSRYENACDDLLSIMKNGQKAGVFCLVIESIEEDEDSRYYRKRLPSLQEITDQIIEVKKDNKDIYLEYRNQKYVWDIRGHNYDISLILSSFKENKIVTDNKIVYLDSVVPKEDFYSSKRRKDFSKNLSIPIGKQGALPINIELRADDSTAHLAIIGTTGSGKTAFINSLILSATKLYSPKELELHLIVMVKGDFRVFQEEKLPHLKTVVTGDRLYAATDVLDFIDEEMKRRGSIIGSLGNIYEYNKNATNPLPRCVIIIDEFLQLVAGSDDAVKRVEAIAQVGRAYGISLVISSTSFPMELNQMKHLMGNRIEFKSEENAGQLIPEAATRQSELESTKGLCFYAHGGNVNSLRVAYSEEGAVFKKHIAFVKEKFNDYQMTLQSDIKAYQVKTESDVAFMAKRPRIDYEDGIIRTRLGKTYLSNKSLEYPFDSKNNLLFLFGHYLETKMVEASLIKDVLVLSKTVDEPTVYYLDMNRNTSLKRAKTIIKNLRDNWVLSGKMVYAGSDEVEDIMSDIKDLIRTREEDEESELYPILVVIARAENAFEDEDMCDELCELINSGKENNVYFAIQCNEPIRFYGSDKYMRNAIIFPDRFDEGDNYSSAALCDALDAMPAGATEKGRKLIANATASALDPKLHLLCVSNNMYIFIPYEYSEEYLKNVIE